MKNDNIINKLKTWGTSTAGKSSFSLLLISAGLIFTALSSWGNLSENTANNINNILIGLATNLLGIIITVSFVQYFIDRKKEEYDEKQERIEEIASIKRYNRLMAILIKKYAMYFNYVITPMDKRDRFNPLALKTDFLFEDMCDMYVQTLENSDEMFKPRIALFYDAEEKLKNYMIRFIENIPFKYNEQLKVILMNFIENSLEHDMRGAILGTFDKKTADNKNLYEVIAKSIKDTPNKWLERAQKNENVGFMFPYVKLYYLMRIEIQLIIEYQNYLKNLE